MVKAKKAGPARAAATVEALETSVPMAGRTSPLSALWVCPDAARATIVVAHGAGAGMRHVWMDQIAAALAAEGLASLRFQFPYMQDGSKRPDLPKVATAAVAAAAKAARALAPKLPLFIGGKSFGGRMSTTAASEGLVPEAAGIVLFGFPLHMAGEPSTKRAAHLSQVKVPMLFLQGDRDALADLALMREVTAPLPLATLHVVDGADHGFAVLKKSGRTNAEVLAELAREARAFVEKVTAQSVSTK